VVVVVVCSCGGGCCCGFMKKALEDRGMVENLKTIKS